MSASSTHMPHLVVKKRPKPLLNKFTKFTLFPKLSPELRFKIWEMASIPRLVTNTPLFIDAIPAVHHTSHEARTVAKHKFPCGHEFKGPVINYDSDILFIREWMDDLNYCFLAVAVQAPALISPVKRLAILLDAAAYTPSQYILLEEERGNFDETTANNLFLLLEQACPVLEELLLVVRPGPRASTINDLHEVATLVSLGDIVLTNGQVMDPDWEKILTDFQTLQTNGNWKGLKVSFVQNEAWAAREIVS